MVGAGRRWVLSLCCLSFLFFISTLAIPNHVGRVPGAEPSNQPSASPGQVPDGITENPGSGSKQPGFTTPPITYYVKSKGSMGAPSPESLSIQNVFASLNIENAEIVPGFFEMELMPSEASVVIESLFAQNLSDFVAVAPSDASYASGLTVAAIDRDVLEALEYVPLGVTTQLNLPTIFDANAISAFTLNIGRSRVALPGVSRKKTLPSGETVSDDGYDIHAFAGNASDRYGDFAVALFADGTTPRILAKYEVSERRYSLEDLFQSTGTLSCGSECVLVNLLERSTEKTAVYPVPSAPHHDHGPELLPEHIPGDPPFTEIGEEGEWDSIGESPGDSFGPGSGGRDSIAGGIGAVQADQSGMENCLETELATEVDYELYALVNESTIGANLFTILQTLTSDRIFRNQLNVGFRITFQHVWTTPNDPYWGSSMDTTLSQFQLHWLIHFYFVEDYDIAHLFSGRLYEEYSGLANYGLCTPERYAMTSMINGGEYIVAHELGHNFGARHDFDLGLDCELFPFLMCYEKPTMSEFSSQSVSYIQDFIAGHNGNCLEQVVCSPESPTPPPVNEIYVADGITKELRVFWVPPEDGLTGYTIYRSDSSGGPWSTIASKVFPPFIDESAERDQTYWYRIRAHRFGQTGLLGAMDSGFAVDDPAAPYAVYASSGYSDSWVRLTWIDPDATHDSQFHIFRSTHYAECEDFLLTRVGANNQHYYDTDVVPDQTYYYSVKREEPDGFVSECSAVEAGHIVPTALPAPSGISASDGTNPAAVEISWSPVPGAQRYWVYRTRNASNPPCSYLRRKGVSAEGFSDEISIINSGREFFYSVRAVGAGEILGACSTVETGHVPIRAPDNVEASDGEFGNRIKLEWLQSGATDYVEIYRSTINVACQGAPSGTVSIHSSVIDVNVEYDETYYYSLKAVSHSGEVSPCSEVDSGYLGEQPDTPSSVTATDGTLTSQIQVAWEGVGNALEYLLYRTESGENACNTSPVYIGPSISFSDDTATPGVYYAYAVRARGTNYGLSECSDLDVGYRRMSTPTNVQATDNEFPNVVQVNWSLSESAAGYRVYRSNSSTPCTGAVLTSTAIGPGYNDYDATPGVTFFYSVKARGANGTYSNCSASDAGSMAGQAPPPPSTVIATNGLYTNKVRVSWSNVPEADSYVVNRTLAGQTSCGVVLADDVTGNLYDDHTADPGVDYDYSVRSMNELGLSGCSGDDLGYRKMGAPSIVAATDGTYGNKIRVTWSQPIGATQYKLYRTSSNSPCGSFLTNVTGNFYDDFSVSPGVTYYYSVKSGGENLTLSDCSVTNPGHAQPAALPSPNNFTASDGLYTSNVRLLWNSVSGASSYKIYRSTSNVGCTHSLENSFNGTAYDDFTAVPGVDYYYSVRARDQWGDLGFCSPVDQGYRKISPPTDVDASDNTFETKVIIVWTPPAGATEYKIYRSDSNSSCGQLLVSGLTSSSYVDFDVNQGQVYYYSVKAQGDNGGYSLCSNVDAGNASPPGVDAPDWVQATNGSYLDKVRISWDLVSNVSSYDLYRSTSSSSACQNLLQGWIVGHYWDDFSAQPGIDYHYSVKARAPNGEMGPCSEIDDGYRKLERPENIDATQGQYSDLVIVNWEPVNGAVHYHIYRTTINNGQCIDSSHLGMTLSGTTYYDFTGAPGVHYDYSVKAEGQNGSLGSCSLPHEGWNSG